MLLNFSNNHRLYSDAQPPESLSQHVWQPPNIEVHLDLKPSKCPRHPVGQAVSPATYNLPQPASVSSAWEGRGKCRALQSKPTYCPGWNKQDFETKPRPLGKGPCGVPQTRLGKGQSLE